MPDIIATSYSGPPRTLFEAEEEISLDKIRGRISGDEELQPFIEFINDETILHFLRGRGYDPDYAFDTLKYYIRLRCEFFDKELVPSTLRIKNDLVVPLRTPGPGGELVLVVRYCWGPYNEIGGENGKYGFEDFLRTIVLVCEELCRHRTAQFHGVSVIIDFEGFRTRHAMNIGNLRNVRKLVSMYYKAVPIRLNGIHYVNASTTVRRGLKLSKEILPQKTASRIYKHKSLESLHTHFDPETLPTWLGGDLEEEDALDFGVNERLLRRDDYYQKLARKIQRLKEKKSVVNNGT